MNAALTPQVAGYHDGVGTESLKWWRAFTGATGWGLARNVRQIYAAISRIYEPGDKLFFFGFSRGAFTVRTLAGLIDTCGLVDVAKCDSEADLQRKVSQAYTEYRRKYQVVLSRVLFGKRVVGDGFRTAHAVRHPQLSPDGRVGVEFVGVWDTVDAVGLPFHIGDFWNSFVHRFKFTDLTLNPRVKRACHALAIDEQRESFMPVLWDEPEGDRRIQQVWFAGVHSNVGGGYPKQGMSLVALDWMMMHAERAGLRFVPSERLYYRQCHSVDDELYNSRAGVAVFYRWKPRNIAELCQSHHMAPKIHASVFERCSRGTAGYAPGNIPPGCQAVYTTHPFPGLAEIPELTREVARGSAPLTAGVQRWIGVALASYYTFLATVLFFAIAVARERWGFEKRAVETAQYFDIIPSRRALFDASFNVLSAHWPVILTGLVLAYGGSWLAERRMDAHFSKAWHRARPRLRKLLGL